MFLLSFFLLFFRIFAFFIYFLKHYFLPFLYLNFSEFLVFFLPFLDIFFYNLTLFDLNFKLLILIRDPRSMYHSRKSLFQRNSGITDKNELDMSKFLTRLKNECRDMHNSLTYYYQLPIGGQWQKIS